MASFIQEIKEEPLEPDLTQPLIPNNEPPASSIERQFESELFYLNNINENVLNSNNNNTDDYELINELMRSDHINNIEMIDEKRNEISIEDVLDKIWINPIKTNIYKIKPSKQNKPSVQNREATQANRREQEQEKLAIEKKRILLSLIEKSKETAQKSNEKHELMSVDEEKKLLKHLNKIVNNMDMDEVEKELKNEPGLAKEVFALRRLRCKLEMRELKRNKHHKLFDVDSYVNELIDSEKMTQLNELRRGLVKKETSSEPDRADGEENASDDVVFEFEALKEVVDGGECEIVAVTQVLDRFKHRKSRFSSEGYEMSGDEHESHLKYLSQMPIGMLEIRYDDVKCVISPWSKKILKPYVRRDHESLPLKLRLSEQIVQHHDKTAKLDRSSIDYVHLRPEHVLPINFMCRQHFWSGIDVSECLQYPDHTIVALYKKLVIGFGLSVPNSSQKMAYLSFIFVHPDWRSPKCLNLNRNVSIAQYMLYYLIERASNMDICLHVSVSSPAILFYQKFGFEIEEVIRNFYDKYYSDGHNLSKDAFLMRLSRS